MTGAEQPTGRQKRVPRETTGRELEALRIWLLGGFRISVGSSRNEEDDHPASVAVPEKQPPDDGRTKRLTRREREVALLVERGLTNRQIASELSLSERTVENHVGRILKKLGFSSRVRLAAWVARQW